MAVYGITKSGTGLKDYTSSSGMAPSENSCKELEVPKILKCFMNILKFIKNFTSYVEQWHCQNCLKGTG